MILLAGNKVDLDDECVVDREAAKVISTIKINSALLLKLQSSGLLLFACVLLSNWCSYMDAQGSWLVHPWHLERTECS